jgi:hypothetical protein
MTRKGRHRDGLEDAAPSSDRAPCTPPEKKMTGSTGRMQGEIPVMRPPKNPIRASEITVVLQGCNGWFGEEPFEDWL